MTNPAKCYVHPAKTQISLGFHQVWSESSLDALLVAVDPVFCHVDPMFRHADSLIRVFAVLMKKARVTHFVGFVVSRLVNIGARARQNKQNWAATTKPTKWYVHPANTQISLGFHQVWSESSLGALLVAVDPVFCHADPIFRHADSEDSDQTRRMPRLIWVFTGRTGHFVPKPTKWSFRPAKTQISLGIHQVWSESSLGDLSPGWSESSLGTQVILLVLSCHGWITCVPSKGSLALSSTQSDQSVFAVCLIMDSQILEPFQWDSCSLVPLK